MTTKKPFVIIGAGAAGMAALCAIRELHPRQPIVVISHEASRFYSKPGLAYWLTGQIPEKQLYPKLPDSYLGQGITHLGAEVLSIDLDAHAVTLTNGNQLGYEKLLLVTGAQAVRPKIDGIDLEGVVTLDTLEDARKILKLARKARRAVVLGGGITALELAEGLCSRGVETHYLMRKDRYWRNVLDAHESRLVENRLQEEGIRIHFRTEIDRIMGKKGRVTGVMLNSGDQINCEMVAVAIGIRPRIALAQQAGIEVDRGVIVNERMETSIEGIYAAGDVAQVWDPESGTHVLDSLWWVAREQGQIAGRNMAGASTVYQRQLPFNVTRIGGITTTLIGRIGSPDTDEDLVSIARGDSETWRTSSDVFAVEKDGEANRVRLLVGERHLHGAVVMGDQSLSRPLQHLIAGQIDISPIRQRLVESPDSLIPIIEGFWKDHHAGQT